jgi:hypothetical protein
MTRKGEVAEEPEQREVLFEADEQPELERPSTINRASSMVNVDALRNTKPKKCCCCIDYKKRKSEIWCVIFAFLLFIAIVGGAGALYYTGAANDFLLDFYRHEILEISDDDTPEPAPVVIVPFNQSEAFITLAPEIAASLDTQTLSAINSIFNQSGTVQTAVYLSASIAASSLALVQDNPTPANMQAAMDNIMRSTECSLAVSNGDQSTAIASLYVSMFATIVTLSDAIAYMNITKLMASATSVTRTNSTKWSDSCSFQLQQFQTQNPERRLNERIMGNLRAHMERRLDEIEVVDVGIRYACQDTSVTDYYYINDAANDAKGMSAASVFLTQLLPKSARGTSVHLLPNPTDGMVNELVTAFQTAAGAPDADITYLNVVKFLLVYASTPDIASMSPLYTKSYKNAAMNNWAAAIAGKTTVDSTVLAGMISVVEDSYFHGKSVVLIGHGQGSRYVDAIYKGIESKYQKYTQLLYISNELNASSVTGRNASSLTRVDDKVVLDTAGAMTGYLHGLVAEDNPIHHNLVFGYLNNEDISNAISYQLANFSMHAVYPENDAQFEIYLKLPSKPSMTFAITEPSGLVVDFEQPYGSFGYFEKNGNNLYFHGCGTPGVGTWYISANIGFAFPPGTVSGYATKGSDTETFDGQTVPPGDYAAYVYVTLNDEGDKEYEIELA